jgi:hypothetical protein
MRRARARDHLNWLWQRGAQELIRLDADAFNRLTGTGNLLRDALTILAAAAWWARQPSSGSIPEGASWLRLAESSRARSNRRARGLACPAPTPATTAAR